MSNPRALPYKQFINRLHTLECCIPVLPTAVDTTFMVFRWGASGYAAKPSGPRCTLIHRDNDYMVPLREIEYAIRLLGLDAHIFWDITDHSAATPASSEQASSGPGK